MKSKASRVKDHLMRRGTITTWEAIKYYRATRLSAIIYDLRQEGYEIASVWTKGKKKRGKQSKFVTYTFIRGSKND